MERRQEISTPVPEVSVIIVSYNVKNELRDCLASLEAESVSKEIFVVDNDSTDGTSLMLEGDFGHCTSLAVICNDANMGFAKASNQAIPLCSGRYVLLLNPDTIVQKGALRKMADHLREHESVGIVAPRLIREDGSTQVSCDTHWGFLRTLIWRVLPWRLADRLYKRRLKRFEGEGGRHVTWVLGAAMMIRASVLKKLRGLDENYFLAADDSADLCQRCLEEGYTVTYYSDAVVVHLGGRSTVDVWSFGLMKAYEGHLYYCRKHYGPAPALLMRVVLFLASLAKAAVTGVAVLVGRKGMRKTFAAHWFASRKVLFMSIPRPVDVGA